jgi:Rrf2 family protein
MFRISRRLDYGIRLMIALAKSPDNNPRPTAALAKELNMPLPFLHQIGHSLMQSGLLKASPGPKGGLRINGPLNNITALRIIEALEGPIKVSPFIEGTLQNEEITLTSKKIWDTLQANLSEMFSGIKLSDLI